VTVPNDHAVISEARAERSRWFHHAMVARRAEREVARIPRSVIRRRSIRPITARFEETRRQLAKVLAIARTFSGETVIID
jgi:hypothetical protein